MLARASGIFPLATFGAKTSKLSRFQPIRSILISAAVFIVAISFLAFIAALTAYQGADTRATARTPQLIELYPDNEPAFYWSDVLDYLNSEYPVQIIYLQPISDQPLPPPGLDKWPEPGQVFVSAGVAERLGATIGTETRWGDISGLISPEGLVNNNEGLIYVGVSDQLSTDTHAIISTGFGAERGPITGIMFYRQPMYLILTLIAIFLVLPALWLLLAVSRIGAPSRARQIDIMKILGAGRKQIYSYLLGETILPITAGTICAAFVASLSISTDIRLPWIDFTIRGSDMRLIAPMVFFAVISSVLIALMVSVTGISYKQLRRTKDNQRITQSVIRLVLPFLLAALTVIGQNLAIGFENFNIVTPILAIGTILTIISVPASMFSAIRIIGMEARSRGFAVESAGQIVGGAQIAARPRPPAVLAASCVILMILASAAADLITAFSGEERDTIALQARLGHQAAIIAPRRVTEPAQFESVLAALQEQYAIASITIAPDGLIRVAGTNNDFEVLGIIPDASILAQPIWLQYLTNGEEYSLNNTPVRRAGEGHWQRIVVGEPDGTSLDIEMLRHVVTRTTVPSWTVTFPGETWVRGAAVAASQAAWLYWFGVIGLGIMLVSLWASYLNELLRSSRSLLAINAIAPSRKFVNTTIAWRIFIPVLLATVTGSMLAIILASKPSGIGGFTLPVEFLAICSVLIILSGLIAWRLVVWCVERESQQFTIGIPDE